jgi:hypothetical protein
VPDLDDSRAGHRLVKGLLLAMLIMGVLVGLGYLLVVMAA